MAYEIESFEDVMQEIGWATDEIVSQAVKTALDKQNVEMIRNLLAIFPEETHARMWRSILIDELWDEEKGDSGTEPPRSTHDENRIRTLVRSGCEIGWADEYGCTILHDASEFCMLGYQETYDQIRILKELGADVHARDIWGRTPLLMLPWEPAMKALIQFGADINAVDHYGNTAMHLVFMEGKYDCWGSARNVLENFEYIECLAALGANPLIQNDDGKIPLQYADDADSRKLLEEYTAKSEAGEIGRVISQPHIRKGGAFKL